MTLPPEPGHQGLSACFLTDTEPLSAAGTSPRMGYRGSPRTPYPSPHPEHPHPWPGRAPSLAVLARRWNPLLLVCFLSLSPEAPGPPCPDPPTNDLCLALKKAPPSASPAAMGDANNLGPQEASKLGESEAGGSSSAPTHTRGSQGLPSPMTGFQETCSQGGPKLGLSHPGYCACPGKATSAVQGPVPARAQRPQHPEQEERAREAPNQREWMGRRSRKGSQRGAREGKDQLLPSAPPFPPHPPLPFVGLR